jgi:diphosphomevalonate decarboxylase
MLIFTKSIFTRRLGSGSACRSVKGQVVVWEKANIGSSDLYGVEFQIQFTKFQEYQDTILLDRGKTSFKYCRS